MPEFQLLTGNINIAGANEAKTVVAKHAFEPMTYPEFLTYQYLHGEGSVTDLRSVGTRTSSDKEERERLRGLFGSSTIDEKLFPGAGRPLPTDDAEIQAAEPMTPELRKKLQAVDALPAHTPLDLAPMGPGTAATTPVELGGEAEQTASDTYPHRYPEQGFQHPPGPQSEEEERVARAVPPKALTGTRAKPMHPPVNGVRPPRGSDRRVTPVNPTAGDHDAPMVLLPNTKDAFPMPGDEPDTEGHGEDAEPADQVEDRVGDQDRVF